MPILGLVAWIVGGLIGVGLAGIGSICAIVAAMDRQESFVRISDYEVRRGPGFMGY